MPLYTKRDLEEDLAQIEKLEHRATELLIAGKMNGFEFNKHRNELDEMRDTLTLKARFTGFLLSEDKVVQRETNNCWKGDHKKGACKIQYCACACGHKWRKNS
jgi:hypothetical protein